MTRPTRTLLIVELVVALAAPVAVLVAGAVSLPLVLPILLTALPSDLATTREPVRTVALPVLMLYGVVAGSLGLYAVIALLRGVLAGVKVRMSSTKLWLLLALGLSALAVPFVLLGPGRLLVWVLGLVLPIAAVAHLVYVYSKST